MEPASGAPAVAGAYAVTVAALVAVEGAVVADAIAVVALEGPGNGVSAAMTARSAVEAAAPSGAVGLPPLACRGVVWLAFTSLVVLAD